jgi:trehalose 6-phosphate phosphatase
MHLLSAEGKEVLRSLAQRAVLAFDFDGTLAPIVDDPARARIGERTRALLAAAARLFPCAVISGRSRADLAARLAGIPGLELAGNHGAEAEGGSPPAALRAQVRAWAGALRDVAGCEGVQVEDKGYSIAVHYRRARSPDEARRRILGLAAALPGARVFGGHAVVNLAPRGAPTKADAIERFAAGFPPWPVLFVGDDETDEDAFRSAVVTHPVRVGRSDRTAARYHLADQGEVDGLVWCLVSERARATGLNETWQKLDPGLDRAKQRGGVE